MEAGLVGDSKSFVAREAMERGHGHGYEACLVEEISMRSHGVGGLPTRCIECSSHEGLWRYGGL